MIAKGASQIRGIRSLNTSPGPLTESKALLRLYLMAVEKDNLMKKLEWISQQRGQTEKRLAEIAHAMNGVQKTMDETARREPASGAHPGFGGMSIQY